MCNIVSWFRFRILTIIKDWMYYNFCILNCIKYWKWKTSDHFHHLLETIYPIKSIGKLDYQFLIRRCFASNRLMFIFHRIYFNKFIELAYISLCLEDRCNLESLSIRWDVIILSCRKGYLKNGERKGTLELQVNFAKLVSLTVIREKYSPWAAINLPRVTP